MKKTLLVTAIAGAIGASAAAQAATVYNQDGTQLDIYGNLQIAYKSIETDDNDDGVLQRGEGSESRDEIFDNGSTFGVTGQHVINPGLTGYFKAEWEFDADEAKGDGGIDTGDQAYIGLKGNFGDARLGSWDRLIDDWIQDPITNNEFFDVTDASVVGDDGFNTQNADNDNEGDKIQYMSPSFGGLQFAVGSQYKGSDENENISDSGNASFFGGLKYTVGAFSVAGVYDNLDNYEGDVSGAEYLVADPNGELISAEGDQGSAAGNNDFDAGEQYGVTFQYTMDALRMALKYERYESGDEDFVPSENRYALGARYGYGMGDIYGAYQYVDVGGDDFGDTLEVAVEDQDLPTDTSDESYNEIILGATYNISSAMYTFAEVAWYDREEDIGDGIAVGAVYAF
ncbi:Outer membrane protein (porin) [Modicisalibacter ilicicola DSM 19980]|uniref:Outer membrane protein (Porin) n=1 Tax=Modicisalibacter ilicicola DSM 19980 TaxID=1121942 RepID=A0A1M4SSC2_9GAMM|nr:porin [Halomonas ilicicola]SHE35071.1 Outer membrane protein (porin) [Halomonas ilicicola DSM 19980]